MTAGRAHPVDHATLALGDRLGQGGQGSIYQVTNRRINETDSGGWEAVYKEYDPALLPGLDDGALTAMAGLLGELDDASRRWLCDKTAWPAAVVQRDGHTSGFLMRAAPDRFHFDYRSLGSPASGTRRLANLEYLLNDDAYVTGIGLAVSDRDRVLLLADLAYTLARLHRIGIAVGDLSPKNLLFTTNPKPEVFLIDCDAMRLHGVTVLPQAETPDWQLPANEETATPTGDIYKLALLAIRLIARDQSTIDPSALAAISPVLGELARSSLTTNPALRPAPHLWAEQLGADAAAVPTSPPAVLTTTATAPPPPPTPGALLQYHTIPVRHPNRRSIPAAGITVRLVAAVALAVAVAVALVLANTNSGSSKAGSTSPGPTVPIVRTPPRPSPPPSPHTYTPTPTPTPTPDPTDIAFSSISSRDCLGNSDDTGTWTPSTPTVTRCSNVEAYFRVMSIVDSGYCDSYDRFWSHRSQTRSDTVLCMNRNYVAGQCMFAKADGQRLSVYFNLVTPCGADFKDDYQYIVQISKVYPDGAPDDACGTDRQWTTKRGIVFCARAVWKLKGLPDI